MMSLSQFLPIHLTFWRLSQKPFVALCRASPPNPNPFKTLLCPEVQIQTAQLYNPGPTQESPKAPPVSAPKLIFINLLLQLLWLCFPQDRNCTGCSSMLEPIAPPHLPQVTPSPFKSYQFLRPRSRATSPLEPS